MAVTGYESLVGLLISRWVSRKLLPRAFQRRSRALRRMSDCVKQKERREDEGGGGEVGDREQGKSKARYSAENNIRADDDDRI